MSMTSEFKEFAIKGNAVDMAVGIVIGAAFGTVVTSLVADIIMPPIGMVLGGVNFSDLAPRSRKQRQRLRRLRSIMEPSFRPSSTS